MTTGSRRPQLVANMPAGTPTSTPAGQATAAASAGPGTGARLVAGLADLLAAKRLQRAALAVVLVAGVLGLVALQLSGRRDGQRRLASQALVAGLEALEASESGAKPASIDWAAAEAHFAAAAAAAPDAGLRALASLLAAEAAEAATASERARTLLSTAREEAPAGSIVAVLASLHAANALDAAGDAAAALALLAPLAADDDAMLGDWALLYQARLLWRQRQLDAAAAALTRIEGRQPASPLLEPARQLRAVMASEMPAAAVAEAASPAPDSATPPPPAEPATPGARAP